MKFKPVPIKLEKGHTVTSLYHSPFDFNLLYLICLAKTGLKLKIVIDDIDNIGIDKSNPDLTYHYSERFFMSKTERTNVRPLSFVMPKHLLANLSYPTLKELDSKVGIATIKQHFKYDDTVEHWIKDVTNSLGSFSLVGPNKAFAFSVIDDSFIQSVRQAKYNIISILRRFPEQSDSAIEFIEWLLNEEFTQVGITISDYYVSLLQRIISKFELDDNIVIQRMSDLEIQGKTRRLLDIFNNDESLRETYKNALAYEGRKSQDDFPFYAISKASGERLLPVDSYISNPTDYLLAPKVLMLNNFENLVLPFHAIESKNVWAREIMYQNKEINCNQIFCDEKWVNKISSFGLNIRLDDEEQRIYGVNSLDTSYFSELIKKGQTMYENGKDVEEKYRGWIITSTFGAMDRMKYPLIFMALLQEKTFLTDIPDFYKLMPC